MFKKHLLRVSKSQYDLNSYKPFFYRLNIKNDKTNLATLLDTNEAVEIFDEIKSQLQELIKLSNPTKRFDNEILEISIHKHLKDSTLEEYGVWVYYPWSNRLVHILDEEEFIKVRTSRNQHKITQEEQEKLRNKKIGVIGLSVGQSVSLTIAIERSCGELRIADFDVLELSNLNRIRTGLHNLGVKKTISVAREIAEIDPFLKVVCFHEGINNENIQSFLTEGGKLDILIDECDGLDMKIVCRQKAKALKIPVVMEASDKGTIDIERFDLEPNRPILHGFIDHLDVSQIANLKSNEEKIPYLLAIAGGETISNRAKASMLEIGQSITTWPQLGSAVTYGGGITADVCRRILINEFSDSGRYFIDLDELIKNKNNFVSIKKDVLYNSSLEEFTMLELIKEASIPIYNNQIELTEKLIMHIVEAGISAPSASNAQPWKWHYHKKNLYLFSNIVYNSELTDPIGSASFIGLGAATENVVLLTHSLGYDVLVNKFPIKNNCTVVAAFSFFLKDDSLATVEKHSFDELVNYIPLRTTNRKITTRQQIDTSVFEDLQKIATSIAGAELKLIHEDIKISKLAEIIAKVDRIKMLDKNGHQDFIFETRWTTEEAEKTRTGIDIHSIDLPPGQIAGLHMAKDWEVLDYLNKWEKGQGLERFSRGQALSASAIGLITMPNYNINDFYEGGRAMERIWLNATMKNISFQPLTIATLIFNTFLYESKNTFSTPMIEELNVLRKEFENIFSINKSVGEIMLFRVFLADAPEKKSLRVPAQKVLSFSKNEAP